MKHLFTDQHNVIFSIYMGIYGGAFVVTSIYCAYFTMKNQSQQQHQSKSPFKQWITLTFCFKSLYLSIIPHIFDQATDIAVIFEYCILINDDSIKNVIDTSYLFWMSIALFFFARVTSTIAIYKLTQNKIDSLLGLLI